MNDAFSDILGQDEFDFSDAGLKPGRSVFEIKSAEKQVKETGVLAVFSFGVLSEIEGLGKTVSGTAWISHDNPKAENIGNATLKKLFSAVYGQPTGSFEGLIGSYVSAWYKEDKSGRPVLSAFQPADDEAVEEARGF
jgi:hypothetical protein